MRTPVRRIGTLALTTLLAGATLAVAPVASALPDCVNTGQRTTQCETGGSTQIVTTPPETNVGGPYGWGGWGIGFGGISIGF
ncbi:hypothetical protein E4P42_03000 [Mycobacterium sp. PS03-16]|uniref:hypothetical protein n=1 Tax=Mycobacterium sp. PS03-16 TaxID=2559611 RepID=UPI00107365E8|nr:hypothetical protein [Mycobacterium sp. PS03-16]TFV61153.1 hypothetical protein E4P42_03000 [Mycobacterium sp. PS03-16]